MTTEKLKVSSIAFIAAMEEELTSLLESLSKMGQIDTSKEKVGQVAINVIKYKNLTIFAALSGVGKVNSAFTTTVILLTYHPSIVINVGVAGGFDKAQHILDFAIANSFVYTDVDITNLGFEPGQLLNEPCYFPANEELISVIKSLESEAKSKFNLPNLAFHYGLLGSSDQFIWRDDQVKRIRKDFSDVICVEMEGASIAHVCLKFNAPLLSIRSLSDIAVADKDNTSDFSGALEKASKLAALLSVLLIEKYANLP